MIDGLRGAFTNAAVLTIALVLLPTAELGASHFSWLGHTACPWDPPQCETRVPTGFRPLGDFRYDFSHIVDEATPEWRDEQRTETLRSKEGRIIARVGPRFRHELDSRGSGRLRDGRIVNTEEQIHGEWRYLLVRNAPFGIGAPGYKLIPFRTVIVDPKHIRLGTVLYLPSLAGVKLPTGQLHDGFCFAHDTEENAGNHIGIFVGFDRDANKNVPSLTGRASLRAYEVDAETAAVLNRRFKEQFDFSE